jgi:hypothetical protein
MWAATPMLAALWSDLLDGPLVAARIKDMNIYNPHVWPVNLSPQQKVVTSCHVTILFHDFRPHALAHPVCRSSTRFGRCTGAHSSRPESDAGQGCGQACGRTRITRSGAVQAATLATGLHHLSAAARAICHWVTAAPCGQSADASVVWLIAAGLCPARPAVSGSFGSGFVLRNDAGGDAPAVADRDALVLRPRPDITAVLTA